MQIDYAAVAPELVLTGALCAVLVVDLVLPEDRKGLIMPVSLLGVAGTLVALLALAGGPVRTTLGGMFVVDPFAVTLKILFCVAALLTLAGFGLGPTFPFTVVVVQNAVALHQLGVATGAMNFFRALGATFIVTMFGAIVLAGGPLTRGMSSAAAVAAIDPNGFHFVFAAAALCLGVALVCVLFLEERPLRGSNPAASVVGV